MSSDNIKTEKVKGKTVPSRYLQSAEKYSSSDGTSSGTFRMQTILKKNTTRIEKNVKTIPNKFSTPHSQAAFPAFDVSALTGPSGISHIQKKDKLKQSSFATTMVKNETTNASTIHKKKKYIPNQTAKNPSTEDLDEEIDILYSRYLLSVLMVNKAKESLKSRSCFALEKFQEVFLFVGLLLERRESLEKEFNLVSFLLKIHKHLQKQEKTLLPILESIPAFEVQYEEIAVAVDNVKHKLYTKDIDLPADGYQGEIIQLMEKVITLLENILQITNNVEDIISTAEAAKCFVNRGTAITDEIKRASEQLSESRDLLLSETSLKFSLLTLEDK